MAKKSISVPDELVKIIDKAKRTIHISFSGSLPAWQREDVVRSVERALARGVEIVALADCLIDPNTNYVYEYLMLRAPYDANVSIYNASPGPVIFFVLVDKKDFILDDEARRLGDRLNGNYLYNKFVELAGRSQLVYRE